MAAAEDYLKQIAERTVRQFERTCTGVQKVSVGSGAIVKLTPTNGATSAIVFVEDGGSTDPTKSIRILETTTQAVTASLGFILGDKSYYEIVGAGPIGEFQMIGIQGGITSTVTIQYYH